MMRRMWELMTYAADGAPGGAAAPGGGATGGATGGAAPAGGASGAGNPFGAADPDPAGGAGGAGNPFGEPPPAEGGPYYPDKLPEHLRGKDEKETLDRLFAAFSGARTEMAKRGKAVDSPDAYTFEVPDEIKGIVGDPSSDPSVKIFRTVAHKHGLTAEQAQGVFADFHRDLVGQGVVQPLDLQAEARKLAGDGAARMSDTEQRQAAAREWQDAVTWIDGLVGAKSIGQDQAGALKALVETADGVLAVKALRGMTREQGVATGVGDGGGQVTKGDLDRRIADPRNQPFSPKYDAEFAAQTDRLFKAMYGGG